MKSTRDAFGDAIAIENNEDIVVMTADLMKATRVDDFAKKHPERFFQVGIAEANMIGIASGLSEYGYKVFITSFASFITGRYDIIRCSLAYSESPVIIVGTHGGLAIGRDGVTQMGLEDLSLMRSLPNMIVLNPATYSEAFKMVQYICRNNLKSPCYLRLGRQPIEDVLESYYNENNYVFRQSIVVKDGCSKIVIFSTGSILVDVLSAVKKISNDLNEDIKVINVNCLKPIDSEFIISNVADARVIYTVEDHSIIGGLGSTILDVLSETRLKNLEKVIKIGLNDVFPESGNPEDLYDKYGLSTEKIYQRIKDELGK